VATDLFKRISGPFKEFGWSAGTLYILHRVLSSISSRLGLYAYEFMVQPIDGRPLLPPNLSKSLTFEQIGPGHPDIAQMPAREDIKARRFEQGAQCLGAYRKGQLIGYLWYATGRYEEDEVRCDYILVDEASSVFDFDLYVLPQHRLGLGFQGIWHGANQDFAKRGIRYTFSRLTRFNVASRRAHAHLGWKRIGIGIFLQLWRLELMAATMSPYVGVTFGAKQRIALKLRPDALNRA